ncbi:hypothetical protein FC83_GL003370 [Agrilactobacillus composti DSM 18527 = JCM 14202]|uniref:HicB-like antitoxin of toxin-antitoxin system domain-containing protein n=1 Tax=Agrilactobacillus composti DSM 18527 = JCM 14202 TaxID=1423734 RepID=X0PSX4_9LACO|nr:type II toxin-antitoxin system HicB family antitoxin [Agrilactobacillus composti]KRM33283.1 hypothetical protein FC83_GL003370 [Agrilactobacillus composti DSM 18527 = JCM 14202]GAF40361.1 hypothetical protein JCM14202_2257 [Agrilactobacillus composti DSM 18527 = JCM 14202]
MSRRVTYPAVLSDLENPEGEYTVTFPDVPGAISEGNGVAEATANGALALGLILFDQYILPNATAVRKVQAAYPGTVVREISVDLDRAQQESQPVAH